MDNTNNKNNSNEIFFNFSYSALKLLGKNLYSNATSAISELVANGIDAKASVIYVFINMTDKKHSVIEILDNGTGMDYSDLAEKYVWVGRNKRIDENISDIDKSIVMGRKGIGKLAALYLSSQYYILTKKNNKDVNCWGVNLLNYEDSDYPKLDRISDNIDLVNKDIWDNFQHGTAIKLENVDLRRNGDKRIEGLRRIFADYYLTDSIGSDIYVAVNTQNSLHPKFEKVKKTIAYKNFYALFDNSGQNIARNMSESISFTWLSQYDHIANEPRNTVVLNPNDFITEGKKTFQKEDGSYVEKKYKLSGWIAVHSTIEQKNAVDSRFIRNSVYQPNNLRLYVRNKLAVSNYFDMRRSTQTMSNYIEGEITFNILDDNDLPDIATSSRQDFLDDERIDLLIELVDPIVNALFKVRNNIGQIIRNENDQYTEYLIEEEKKRKEVEEEKRKKAEEEAIKAKKEKEEAKEKQRMAEETAKRERRRSQYVIDVTGVEDKHIVNSIHSIYNSSNRVKENLDKINNLNGFPESGKNELQKASTSNQKILSVSKMISKAGGLIDNNDAKKKVNLTEFIAEYVNKILIKIYSDDNMAISITGDLDAIFQIKVKPLSFIMMIDNIVGNAIKAKANNFVIIIDDSNKESFRVIFKDDGVGVNSAIQDLNSVFEFGVTTTNGSGLGLFYAKKQMNSLKGDIQMIPNEKCGVSIVLSWKK